MTLRDWIEGGGIHLVDGAMGTVLYQQGIFVNVCYDALALTEPERVRRVHEAYLHAGAGILETNSFGANPVKLSAWGLDRRTEEVNRAAARVAREAAGSRAFVLGAVGPLGLRIEPWGATSRDEAHGFFTRQMTGLLEGGIDGFILETFSDAEEARIAVEAARALSPAPIFALVSVGEEGSTAFGTPVEEAARILEEAGADVLGVNCSVGPAVVLEAIERIAATTRLPLAALPNAGVPRAVGDRKIYMASPDYFGLYAPRLVEAGARFLGGCCGTTPEHIRAMGEALGARRAGGRAAVGSRRRLRDPDGAAPAIPSGGPGEGSGGASGRIEVGSGPAPADRPAAAALGSAALPLAQRSRWGAQLASGDPVRIASIASPRGWDLEPALAPARALLRAGAQALLVPDPPAGSARMGSLAAAALLGRRVEDGEFIARIPARGRRMEELVGDLLAAAAAGVRNLLLVTGEPSREGPGGAPDRGFEIDSIGLVNVVRRLNEGLDPAGQPLGLPTPFVIGASVHPGAPDPEREFDRVGWKVEAGADVLFTRPVFDAEVLARFLERAPLGDVPVVATVLPLSSLRQAEFLANELPGSSVPRSILERIRSAEERGGMEAAAREGLDLAGALAADFEGIGPRIRGVHWVAPGIAPGALAPLLSAPRPAHPSGDRTPPHTPSGGGAPPELPRR